MNEAHTHTHILSNTKCSVGTLCAIAAFVCLLESRITMKGLAFQHQVAILQQWALGNLLIFQVNRQIHVESSLQTIARCT